MPDSGRRSILLVDDDHAVRRWATRVLIEAGYAILEAGSAQEALDAVDAYGSKLTLAVIDLVMPGASGLDAAAEINRRLPSLPILYISGRVESIAMEAIARRSPVSALYKPFTGAVLLDRIRSLLSESSHTSYTDRTKSTLRVKPTGT